MDDDGHLFEHSFTLLYCRLLAARSLQRNSGEPPLIGPALSRYARMLWIYSSSSSVFGAWKAGFFVAGIVINGVNGLHETFKTIAQAFGVGHSVSFQVC